MDRMGSAGLMMMVAGGLAFVGLFLPWYGYYAEVNSPLGGYIIQAEYGWSDLRYYTTGFGQSTIQIKTYNQANLYRTGEVMGAGHGLVALGALMLGGGGLVALAGGRGLRLSPQALSVVGILGFLMLILGIVYVAAMLPGAQLQDGGGCQAPAPCSSFIGTDSSGSGSSTSRESWGPGIGWVLPIPGAIIGILGALQMRSVPRGVSPAGPYGAPPGAPMYATQAPAYGYADPSSQRPYGQPPVQQPGQQWPPDSGGQRGW